MPVSPAMRRLLRLLEIEEEQSRMALESALGELNRMKRALVGAIQREHCGRKLVISSARSHELTDRLAGLEETRFGRRHATALAPKIADIELNVAARRRAYLNKRVERRQAETLIREAEARDVIEADRHSQRALDDWFLDRLHRAEKAEAAAQDAATSSPQGSSRTRRKT